MGRKIRILNDRLGRGVNEEGRDWNLFAHFDPAGFENLLLVIFHFTNDPVDFFRVIAGYETFPHLGWMYLFANFQPPVSL